MDKKNAVLPGSACVHMFLFGLAPAAPDCAGKIRTINAESPGFSPLGLRRCDQQNDTFCAISPPMTSIFTATGAPMVPKPPLNKMPPPGVFYRRGARFSVCQPLQ